MTGLGPTGAVPGGTALQGQILGDVNLSLAGNPKCYGSNYILRCRKIGKDAIYWMGTTNIVRAHILLSFEILLAFAIGAGN